MAPPRTDVDEGRFRGEPSVVLRAGDLEATFLPQLGMTGVSLRHRGGEHLALPGGLDALRAGKTLGLPLLAPWANRLSRRRYEAAGVAVDLTGLRLRTDANGLPIHGLLVGRPGWQVDLRPAGRSGRVRTRPRFRASIDIADRAFPFPHRLDVAVSATDHELRLVTTVTPTGDRAVPIAFGWHPYLRLPARPRREWRLELPARTHQLLDDRGIPTGATASEAREAEPIGRRTFDDLYRLGRDHRMAFTTEDGSVTVRGDAGYPWAQVWVPRGKPFAALEPMTAPTDALGEGTAPLVAPGGTYEATFAITLEPSD